jgi:hypothetical protein
VTPLASRSSGNQQAECWKITICTVGRDMSKSQPVSIHNPEQSSAKVFFTQQPAARHSGSTSPQPLLWWSHHERNNSHRTLGCMRTKNVTDILNAIPPTSGGEGITGTFGPTADDVVVFSNCSTIKPVNTPWLIGNNDNEAGLLKIDLALSGTITIPDSMWDVLNLQESTCLAALGANDSVSAGSPIWRYGYFGDFPNQEIAAGSGAWHGVEVPFIFGAPPATDAPTVEVDIGKYIRGAWVTFAKDTKNGLSICQGG